MEKVFNVIKNGVGFVVNGANDVFWHIRANWLTILVMAVMVYVWIIPLVPTVQAAGIDDVTVSFTDSQAINTETRIVVTFTPTTALTASSTISIYLGETTAGDEFTDGDADQDGTDINCVQTGSTFENGSQADATATVPMLYYVELASVGAGTGTVTCTLGDGATDAPSTPNAADGYSVAVVTENDSGAGIAYVGNANDVTVSVAVLPNLALTIDAADGTYCTTTSGVTSCNLGTATTAAVNSGYYDVNVGSNAASGVTLSLGENGNLRNGSDDINDVADSAVTAGSEEYGVAVTTSGTWTIDGTYDGIDAPVITGPDVVATTTGGINIAGDDINVVHKVAISSLTKALTYSHIVTWTATANF